MPAKNRALLLLATALALTAADGVAAQERPMNLSDHEGEVVEVEGRISENPWQHLIDARRAASALYFDLDDGDQIVAYAPEPQSCPGRLRLTGVVIRVEGRSKRPGSDERYAEHQLEVTKVECLASPAPDAGDSSHDR